MLFQCLIGAAELTYMCLLSNFNVCSDYDMASASEIITSTEWDRDDKIYLLENKRRLMSILGMQYSVENNNVKSNRKNSKKDELDSYESLVREAGKISLKFILNLTVIFE